MKALRLTVQLNVDEDPHKPLAISASLPLLADETANGLAKLSVESPAYLSRSDSEKLEQELTSIANEAVTNSFTARDNASHIMDAGQRLVFLCSELCQAAADTMEEQQRKEEVVEDGELQRVWFWFPSLSTREKRKDLVTYASRWGLTGFVLAGTLYRFCTLSLEGLLILFLLHRQARTAMPRRIRKTRRRVHGGHQIRIMGRHPIIPEERYALPPSVVLNLVQQLNTSTNSDGTIPPDNPYTRIHRHARDHAPHHATRRSWQSR